MPEPERETILFRKMPGVGQWQIETEGGRIITGLDTLHADLDHGQVHVTFNVDIATMRTTEVP